MLPSTALAAAAAEPRRRANCLRSLHTLCCLPCRPKTPPWQNATCASCSLAANAISRRRQTGGRLCSGQVTPAATRASGLCAMRAKQMAQRQCGLPPLALAATSGWALSSACRAESCSSPAAKICRAPFCPSRPSQASWYRAHKQRSEHGPALRYRLMWAAGLSARRWTPLAPGAKLSRKPIGARRTTIRCRGEYTLYNDLIWQFARAQAARRTGGVVGALGRQPQACLRH